MQASERCFRIGQQITQSKDYNKAGKLPKEGYVSDVIQILRLLVYSWTIPGSVINNRTLVPTRDFDMRTILYRQHFLWWQWAHAVGPPIKGASEPNFRFSIQNCIRRIIENCHHISCLNVQGLSVYYMLLRQQKRFQCPLLHFSFHTRCSLSL